MAIDGAEINGRDGLASGTEHVEPSATGEASGPDRRRKQRRSVGQKPPVPGVDDADRFRARGYVDFASASLCCKFKAACSDSHKALSGGGAANPRTSGTSAESSPAAGNGILSLNANRSS